MSELKNDEYYNADLVNIMRLKVNKVNLVQSLNVNDELLSDLMKARLIYYEEAVEIMRGQYKEDKAKILIDILINRESPRKDWYIQFRSLLAKRKYNDIVIFLDNTIIKKPKLATKFSDRYQLSNNASQLQNKQTEILNSDNSLINDLTVQVGSRSRSSNHTEKKTSQTHKKDETNEMYDKSYEILVKKEPSYSNKPLYLINDLEKSGNPDDSRQLKYENLTFEAFKKLETVYSSYVNDRESFKESFFLDTGAVKTIFDSPYPHLLIKYYKHLSESFDIDMLKFFNQVIIEKFKQEKIIRLLLYDDLDELINKLLWTHIRNEKYDYADELLTEYLNYLNFVQIYLDKLTTENNNTNNESLTDNSKKILLNSRFNVLSHLIFVKNNLFDFKSAFKLFNEALEFVDENDETVSTTNLYFSIANTYMEMADYNKAYDYIIQSLKSLNYEDEIFVDLLGLTSLCYSNKWEISKAEKFAILALQASKFFYGRNHSNYVRALLIYTNFANEYFHDESCIRLANTTLNLAKRVYGFDSIQVAEAYKNLSKAFTINKLFKEGLFYEYAFKAFKIASNYYRPNNAKLLPFKLNLVSALQWRSINSNIIEIRRVNLNDANNLCFEALKICINIFGENNFVTAKIYRLLGSLYYYMEKDDESEQIHKKSLEILGKILPHNDLHYLLAKSTLGVFYKMAGKIEESTNILLQVVNELKIEELASLAVYCKWISSVYSNLSECYRIKKMDQLATYYQRQTENLKNMSSNKHFKHDINEISESEPPISLNDFLYELVFN